MVGGAGGRRRSECWGGRRAAQALIQEHKPKSHSFLKYFSPEVVMAKRGQMNENLD